MKKSKSFSNKSVTQKDLLSNYSAFSLILLAIFAIVFFGTTLGPSFLGNSFSYELSSMLQRPDSSYCFSVTETELGFAIIIPFVVFMLQFSFLHKKSSCYTTLSFNISRNKLYRNRLLLPLLFIIATVVLVKLYAFKINVGVFGFDKALTLVFAAHLLTYLKIILFSIFCTVASCLLCGRTIEAAAAAASMFIFPSALSMYMGYINSFSLYGADEYSTTIFTKIASILNPLDWTDYYYLYPSYYESVDGFSTPLTESIVVSLVWIAVLCISYVAMAHYFKRCYKPEKSGFKGASAVASSFISVTLPLIVTLISFNELVFNQYLAYVKIGSLVKYLILCLLIFVICALVCNFLTHFTLKKFKYALTGIIAAVSILLVLAGINSTDIFGTYNVLPDKAQVKEIHIEFPSNGMMNAIDLSGNVFFGLIEPSYDYALIDTENEIELVMDFHKTVVDNRDKDTTLCASFTYFLKDGTKLDRTYHFLSDEALLQAMKFRQSKIGEDYLRERLLPDTVVSEYTGEIPSVSYENSNLVLRRLSGDTASLELSNLSEEEHFRLRKAIFEDAVSIPNDEWFYPTTTPLGYLVINTPIYNDTYWYSDETAFAMPVYPSMKKTLSMLEELGWLDILTKQDMEIKEVYVAELADMVEEITASEVTGPIFTSLYPVTINLDTAPVTRVEDPAQWDELLKNAHPYYYVGSEPHGRLLIIKLDDSEKKPAAPTVIYYMP